MNQHDRASCQGPSCPRRGHGWMPSGFLEDAVGDLKHADGARGRSVHFEWVPTEPPPPIGTCHWVAAALHLGQRGQQFRRDNRGGVRCEERGRIRRQVWDGALKREPLTGKNASLGLRATCTTQFSDAQTVTTRKIPMTIRIANGATRKVRSARLARRHAAERRARRRRMCVLEVASWQIGVRAMRGIPPVCPVRRLRATRLTAQDTMALRNPAPKKATLDHFRIPSEA